MSYYWFGDSWVVGQELDMFVPAGEQQNFAFPKLVSDYFSDECINLGESGSSVDIIPYKFSKIVANLKPKDRIFFCLTASLRSSILSNESYKYINTHFQILNSQIDVFWYKYIDSEQQRLYNYDRTINLLYLWTKELGIECYFFNLFTIEPKIMFNLVPDENWIVPRNKCIAQEISHLVDKNNANFVDSDRPGITVEDWKYQEDMLKKYVYPCQCHPNLLGHQTIANVIIEKLQNAKIS